jgi:hypothetical protein
MRHTMHVPGSCTARWRVTLPRLCNLAAGAKFEVVMAYATRPEIVAHIQALYAGAAAD